MALDTKQKRGSSISIALPWRQWLLEPDGTIATADKLSLLRYSSAPGLPASSGGPLLCGTMTVSPLLTGRTSITTLLDGTVIVTPLLTGESELSCECGC